MSPDAGAGWLRHAPRVVAGLVAVALVGALGAVVAVDVLDAFGLRDAIFVQRDSDYPYAFYHLFADRQLVEWMQWLLLVVAAVALGVAAGRLLSDGDPRPGWGIGVLALALGVLAVQDAGDQRQAAADLAEGLGGPTVSLLVELAVLGVLGLLAVGGLVVAWPAIRHRTAPRNLLLAGYAVYGIIAVMHLTSDLWYVQAGTAVVEDVFGGRMLDAPASWEPGLLEWLIMDAVVEESMELVADGLLAGAALVLLRDLSRVPAAAGRGGLVDAPRRV